MRKRATDRSDEPDRKRPHGAASSSTRHLTQVHSVQAQWFKRIFRIMRWRIKWDEETNDPEVRRERQTQGTTKWSREWCHFRRWSGEPEPTVDDIKRYLREEAKSEELDDFLSTNAATEWLLDNNVKEMHEGQIDPDHIRESMEWRRRR